MSLFARDSLDALLGLQAELERAFRRPLGLDLGLSGHGAEPPMNIFRGPLGYLLCVEAPGLTPADLSIETHGRTLTLHGKRAPTDAAAGSFHRRERWSGEFSRSLQLPEDADPERTEAGCKNGILTIRTPKLEAAKPHKIAIRAE